MNQNYQNAIEIPKKYDEAHSKPKIILRNQRKVRIPNRAPELKTLTKVNLSPVLTLLCNF